MHTIVYNGRIFTVRARESVLAALLRQGAAPVFSCGRGSCTVCMQRCTSGTVPPAAQRGLKSSLVEKGYFLPCICQPVDDMCIEPPRAEDLAFRAKSFASRGEVAPASDAHAGGVIEQTVFNPDTFPPDPEMWRALGEGRLLNTILDDFYTRVFADERLAPYFQRVTKERVIGKVYSFLQQAFTGVPAHFVEHPRNAHHWMVIDDDLFDYRERMLVNCMQRHGLAPHLVERWRSMEERFRRDIVKDEPWNRIVGGIELPVEGYGEIALEVATLCDGCGAEIRDGEKVSYHRRLGTVYGHCCRTGL